MKGSRARASKVFNTLYEAPANEYGSLQTIEQAKNYIRDVFR